MGKHVIELCEDHGSKTLPSLPLSLIARTNTLAMVVHLACSSREIGDMTNQRRVKENRYNSVLWRGNGETFVLLSVRTKLAGLHLPSPSVQRENRCS